MGDETFDQIDEDARRRFEQAWGSDSFPSIGEFLPSSGDPKYRPTLEELIYIDIEMRWKRWARDGNSGESRPQVELYLNQFPILLDTDLVIRLVKEEQRIRIRMGDRYARAEYERRFPKLFSGTQSADPDETNSIVSGSGDSGIDSHLTSLEQVGSRIGPYKLLQRIGEGGMGVVFMASQSKPIERMVAIKVIKPGMDSKEVVARFEAERQALAMMDHPNIARVLDAGMTEGGRPYFVMDLVKGVPISQYCDERKLTAQERLRLFIDVCHAAQHAHQKGIIHRDIKPTNVLVAEHDDIPVPKIIDFGVAKAVQGRLTDKTLFTEFGQVVGTFAYMSPEQAKLNQLDIDTRSDIYSLGVMLYELLTGETPFDKTRFSSVALDEILRIIREEDPPSPSHRLTSSHSLPAIAEKRRSEPRKLSLLIRGELDWIVMKSLEKERKRRYATANELAADIERYLNGEPVSASPPSVIYRLRKTCRRHWATIATSAVLLAAVLVGSVVSTFLAVQATTARNKLAGMVEENEGLIAELESALGDKEKLIKDVEDQRDQAQRERNAAVRAEQLALKEKNRAREKHLLARRYLYAAQLNLAGDAWRNQQPRAGQMLLQEHFPTGPDDEVRGFGWYHLWNEWNLTRHWWRLPQPNTALTPEEEAATVSPGTVAVHPSQQLVATGFRFDSIVTLRDAVTGETLHEWEGPNEGITAIAFSPDGNLLAAGGSSSRSPTSVRVWNMKTRERVTTLPCHSAGIGCLEFSPDGKLLASAPVVGTSDEAPGEIKIWETSGFGEIQTIPGDGQGDYGLAFGPESNELTIAQQGVRVKRLNPRTSENLTSPQFKATSVAYAPDGRLLLCSDTEEGILWNPEAERADANVPTATAATVSSDGSGFALARPNGTIEIFRITGGKVRRVRQWQGHYGSVRKLAFDNVNGELVSAGHDGVRVWRSPTIPDLNVPADAGRFALAPTGDSIAIVSAESQLSLFQLPSGELLHKIDLPAEAVALAYKPDSTLLTIAHPEGDVTHWNIATGENVGTLSVQGTLTVLKYAPDGKYLLLAGYSEAVGSVHRGWFAMCETTTPSLAEPVNLDCGPIADAAFSPNGSLLAIAAKQKQLDDVRFSTGELIIWDLRCRQAYLRALSPVDVLAVSFSPDGSRLVSGIGSSLSTDASGKAIVWNVAAKREVTVLEGHSNVVSNVCFSPNGSTVATTSGNTIRLWDTDTWQPCLPLSMPAGSIEGLEFSSDGQALFASSDGEPITSWQAADPALVANREGPVWARSAHQQAERKQWYEAIDSFSRAIACAPNPDWHLSRARSHAIVGDFNAAVSDFNAALDSGLDDPRLLHDLAIAQLAVGDLRGYESTCDTMLQSARRNRENTALALWTSTITPLPGHDYAEEVAEARRMIGNAPDAVESRVILAAALVRSGNFEAAVETLNDIAWPPYEESLSKCYRDQLMAIALANLGRNEEARSYLQLATTSTNQPAPWNRRKIIEFLQQEASNAVNKVVVASPGQRRPAGQPTDARGWFDLAREHAIAQRSDRAYEAYVAAFDRQPAKVSPRDIELLVEVARQLGREAKFLPALDLFAHAEKYAEDLPHAEHFLSDLRAARNIAAGGLARSWAVSEISLPDRRQLESWDDLRRQLTYAEILQSVGEIQSAEGRADEAIRSLNAASVVLSKLTPHHGDDTRVRLAIAENAWSRAQLERARTDFPALAEQLQRCVEAASQVPTAKRTSAQDQQFARILARAASEYASLGLWTTAAECFDQMARLAVTDPQTNMEAATIHLALGETKQYGQYREEALAAETPDPLWPLATIVAHSGSDISGDRLTQLAQRVIAHRRGERVARAFYPAVAFVHTSKPKKAMELLERADKYCSNDFERSCQSPVRAMILWDLGETDEARNTLAEADSWFAEIATAATNDNSLRHTFHTEWRDLSRFRCFYRLAVERIRGEPLTRDPWLRAVEEHSLRLMNMQTGQAATR